MTFSEYLEKKGIGDQFSVVLKDLSVCFKEIADVLRKGNEGYSDGENVYGDKQVKLDVISNDLLLSRMKANGNVGFVGSEEMEVPFVNEEVGENEGFSVVSDPLDGSSLVNTNLAVGTIVGIYEGKGVLGKTGRDQVASMISVYGPRLTFMITLGEGVDEFIYDYDKSEFVLYHENLKIKEEGKVFMPGGSVSAASEKWYMDLVNFWFNNGYKLRYSGGMVPDINQIIKKEGGIFAYPGSSEHPDGKLRLLYESAPMGMIIEQAGGEAFVFAQGRYAEAVNVLDVKVESLEQQTPLVIGSKKEVERAISMHK